MKPELTASELYDKLEEIDEYDEEEIESDNNQDIWITYADADREKQTLR